MNYYFCYIEYDTAGRAWITEYNLYITGGYNYERI